jgi:hypothetical protein
MPESEVRFWRGRFDRLAWVHAFLGHCPGRRHVGVGDDGALYCSGALPAAACMLACALHFRATDAYAITCLVLATMRLRRPCARLAIAPLAAVAMTVDGFMPYCIWRQVGHPDCCDTTSFGSKS